MRKGLVHLQQLTNLLDLRCTPAAGNQNPTETTMLISLFVSTISPSEEIGIYTVDSSYCADSGCEGIKSNSRLEKTSSKTIKLSVVRSGESFVKPF